MSEFRMPSLGADMDAGTLVEWLKRPGEAVKRGDIIAVVETQKGAIEVEIFEDGVVERFLVAPGATVPVGTPLAVIAASSEQPSPLMGEGAGGEAKVPPPVAAPSGVIPAPRLRGGDGGEGKRQGGKRPLASPAARRMARERGIDLSALGGSGPGGAVISRDLPAAAKPAKKFDAAAMRQAIAAAMARSKREIPHYYLGHDIDVTAPLTWLEQRNAGRPPTERVLSAVLFVKAVALALRRFPELNGFFTAEGFRPAEAIHVGMAVSLRGGGLVAPALRDADGKTLDELMADMRDLVARARSGGLRASELSDPTITVSSLGDRGVDALIGVIIPPQVALVGIGTPAAKPWVVGGKVKVRTIAAISLAGDHRVSDGHRGALFLREIDTLLQQPEAL